LEQAHKEAESLQIKLDKISTQLCLNKVVEVLGGGSTPERPHPKEETKEEPKVEVKPEPKPEPKVEAKVEPKVVGGETPAMGAVGGETPARKPRIKIHIPEPKEKVDLKVSLPLVGRRRC
jgi:hypothetical protein